MKTEYMLLSVFAGWLLRGLAAAYQNRASLTLSQMGRVALGINLGGSNER